MKTNELFTKVNFNTSKPKILSAPGHYSILKHLDYLLENPDEDLAWVTK